MRLRLLVTTIIPSQREAKGSLLLNLSLANAPFLLTLIYLPVPSYLQENVKVKWLGAFFSTNMSPKAKAKDLILLNLSLAYASFLITLIYLRVPWYLQKDKIIFRDSRVAKMIFHKSWVAKIIFQIPRVAKMRPHTSCQQTVVSLSIFSSVIHISFP